MELNRYRIPGRRVVLIAGLLLASPALATAQSHPDDRYWVDPFPAAGHPNEYTDAIVPYDGGLLLGGLFSAVADMNVLRIAHWDGSTWRGVGSGVGTNDMGLVHVIRVGEGCLYAGGMFDQLGPWAASSVPRYGNIARYDFGSGIWLPLGDGMDRAVRGISIAPNGDLYCVGEFTSAGGVKAQGVARWDGSAWHDVGGSLGPRARALAIAATGDAVYVGGFFDSAGGKPISYIARWTGEEWEPLGSGVNNLVTTIRVEGNKIYVGGAFTEAGGKPANRIAVWDGQKWGTFGDGLGGPSLSHVRSIEIDIDQLYVTGTFTHAAGKEVGFIATWDGSAWSSLGSGVNDQTKIAMLRDGALWVGGNFTQAGGKDIAYVAQWTKPGKNAVVFDRLRARRTGGGVKVEWAFTAWGPWVEARLVRREAGGEYESPVLVNAADGEYMDVTASADRAYEYALAVERGNGTEAWSAPVRVAVVPPSVQLHQNHPNPFNPSTTIRFSLPAATAMTLRIYDVSGRAVRTLVDGTRGPGELDATWDGRDDRGVSVATGVYFYRLAAAGETLTRKMILVK
ncbi:MAG TPA: FlgD immunoglobulin-like domain containing protein [Candidatus Krumholzibacteria bacterium]|nr:FlgD immunoglobulin-like domain containing protein [Candidatus Krumholzibacteria bacterium]